MKIAQPYRCDGPGCKKLREDDFNHWWLVALFRDPEAHGGEARFFVNILPWDDRQADECGDYRHACGIDCAQKIAAHLMAQILDGGRAHA